MIENPEPSQNSQPARKAPGLDDWNLSDFKMTHTWDGKEIVREAPFGCTVFVYRRSAADIEVLMLHRAHLGAEYEGDWAWTAPSGARQPGEEILDCAARELYEESGLQLALSASSCGTDEWPMYMAEAGHGDCPQLIDREHDRFEWVAAEEALRRASPRDVRESLERVIAMVRGAGAPGVTVSQ